MSAMFHKPSTPVPPAVAPPPPTIDNSAAATDVAEQSLQASLQRGRSSTVLTGGQGATVSDSNTKKVLLGQ